MKHIIQECELNIDEDISKYDNLVSFVLADGFLVEVLKEYFKHIYEFLESSLKCRIVVLLVKLRLNDLSNKCLFWKSLLQVIKNTENNLLFDVGLSFLLNENKYDHIQVTLNIKGTF